MNTMTIPEAESLHNLMVQFELNPRNPENAYLYFRELNKHGMYLTVIRLF